MSTERLYALLPAIHRIRDAERGEPLRALLGVIEELHDVLERDIAGLYDDWFIETCAEWVVPYLGDLVGARPLDPPTPDREGDMPFSLRAYVANTLAYRRRKGTARMLEQLARDVTGWPARAVEYFQLLAGTQHLNHPRLGRARIGDLRSADALELVGTPFDSLARTVNVRAIADVGRVPAPDGGHNIPNIGLHLWRLQAYPVHRATARAIAPGVFTFDPLGGDHPLFGLPRTETAITSLAEERNAPVPLRRRPLHDELEALRHAVARDAALPAGRWFGADEPVIEVWLDGVAVPPEQILICDLSDRPTDPPTPPARPPAARAYPGDAGGPVDLPIAVAVDPVTGRLAIPETSTASAVEVGFAYGFSGDLGGGPYDRTRSFERRFGDGEAVTWQAGVVAGITPDGQRHPTIAAALAAWSLAPVADRTRSVIAIMDSATYVEDLDVEVPAGCQLVLVAGDWPPVLDPTDGVMKRVPGHVVLDGVRPHLRGSVTIRGEAGTPDATAAEVVVNGLLIEGGVTVRPGHLGGLAVEHSTLVPGRGGVVVENAPAGSADTNAQLALTIDRCVCDRVRAAVTVPAVAVYDAIVGVLDATDGTAVDARGAHVEIESSTIFEAVRVGSLAGSNSLFAGAVRAEQRQRGCLRYSFIAEPNSRTPRRFRCQPELALAARALARGLDSAAELRARERAHIVARVRPTWESAHHGDPAFGQLRRSVPPELRAGAEDGQEMGAFRHLQQTRREGNLATSLDEYLRLGLAAGIFFES